MSCWGTTTAAITSRGWFKSPAQDSDDNTGTSNATRSEPPDDDSDGHASDAAGNDGAGGGEVDAAEAAPDGVDERAAADNSADDHVEDRLSGPADLA